jgi:hypothetical protein
VARTIAVSASVALATLAFGGLLVADEGWRVIAERNGVTLEKRPVAESHFYEYRARGHTSLSPTVAAARIWEGIGAEHSPPIKHRTVLQHEQDVLVVYDQIHAAVVKDRDVTIRIRKVSETGTGAFQIQFESTQDMGPPPAVGYVRLPVVRGSWRIEPASDGGANVSYACYSEPGGSIPAFLVRGVQQDQVLDELERVLTRVNR